MDFRQFFRNSWKIVGNPFAWLVVLQSMWKGLNHCWNFMKSGSESTTHDFFKSFFCQQEIGNIFIKLFFCLSQNFFLSTDFSYHKIKIRQNNYIIKKIITFFFFITTTKNAILFWSHNFGSESSRHCQSETIRARELKF